MASTGWEASSVQLAGILKQVKARGLLEKALGKCAPASRAVLENPYSARWHPGAVLADLSEALIAVSDAATFEAINYDMAKASFGPILRPMVQVALALTGRSPATVLARVPASLEPAVRNVSCVWAPEGKNGGALTFSYPSDVSRNSEFAWRGAIRFVGDLSGQPIRVTKLDFSAGRTLKFTLAW